MTIETNEILVACLFDLSSIMEKVKLFNLIV